MLAHACIPLHRCLHRCLHMLAFACIDACICLHMLAFACIDACVCLHPPASMLAYACIPLHRCLRQRCIASAFACIEPNRPKAKRAGSFDSLTRESSRRARRVTAREERERGRTPVPPPSSFVLSSPSRFCPSLLRPPSFFPVPSSPALSSARPSSVLLVLSSPSRPSSILSRSSIACLVACLVLRHHSRPFPSLSRCRPGRVRCSFLDSRGTMELAAREAVAEIVRDRTPWNDGYRMVAAGKPPARVQVPTSRVACVLSFDNARLNFRRALSLVLSSARFSTPVVE